MIKWLVNSSFDVRTKKRVSVHTLTRFTFLIEGSLLLCRLNLHITEEWQLLLDAELDR